MWVAILNLYLSKSWGDNTLWLLDSLSKMVLSGLRQNHIWFASTLVEGLMQLCITRSEIHIKDKAVAFMAELLTVDLVRHSVEDEMKVHIISLSLSPHISYAELDSCVVRIEEILHKSPFTSQLCKLVSPLFEFESH